MTLALADARRVEELGTRLVEAYGLDPMVCLDVSLALDPRGPSTVRVVLVLTPAALAAIELDVASRP